MRKCLAVVVVTALISLALVGQIAPSGESKKQATLADVHKLFLEPMGGADSKGAPLQLEQYIKAELAARLANRIIIVTRKENADAVMVGTGDWRNTSGAALTGRYLGLHDTSTGAVSIEKDGVVMWSSEAGDRSLFMGTMSRNGPRKVASRIVKHLQSALEQSDAASSRKR